MGAGLNRHDEARKLRVDAANIAYNREHAIDQKNNGEETDYIDSDGNRTYIGNYSKGLPHHPINNLKAGEVVNTAYESMMRAITSANPQDFEDVQLGLGRRLTDPQAGLSFDLEGADSHDLSLLPAPRIDGPQAAGEMAELYWMALCRDIQFGDFMTDFTLAAAASDLSSRYSNFPVPLRPITSKTIFRGYTNGDIKGPYISQFLYQDVVWGSLALKQRQRVPVGGKEGDYLYDYSRWLEAQNGKDISSADKLLGDDSYTRYMITPRDLCYYVHVDVLYEAYLHAALILLHNKVPLDPGNPYEHSRTQIGFGTFGSPHILSLVTEVATRALKAVWFQKWFVHRRLRPEGFAGLIHRMKSTGPSPPRPNPLYSIHKEVLNSRAVDAVFGKYGAYLLPQAFPEGSPTHPSYGSGHATVAGACVTILKAWFREDTKISEFFDPVIPDQSYPYILSTTFVPDGGDLTVGGELDKLASNIAIGRNWAGIHYRSDYKESLELGEKIAITILEEQKITYREVASFSLTKFDGTTITL
jgi:hypothetical protein